MDFKFHFRISKQFLGQAPLNLVLHEFLSDADLLSFLFSIAFVKGKIMLIKRFFRKLLEFKNY